jgi:sugar-specific transcriptional regulator TrmB
MNEQTVSSLAALEELGMTHLEAMTYVALLKNGPSTAYSIAKSIHRPASNAYRVIESLVAKFLVVVEDGKKKRFRALPYEQMLSALSERFKTNQDLVASALSDLQSVEEDDSVYRLNSPEQVFDRCRSALENAAELVLIDAFPGPLSGLVPYIESALDRGVEIMVKAYLPIEIPGAEIILDYRGDSVLETWDSQWLILVADGNESVQASFEPDGLELRQAIWTGSAFHSWITYGGLVSEMRVDLIGQLLEQGGDIEAVRRVMEMGKPARGRSLPGRRRLLADAID